MKRIRNDEHCREMAKQDTGSIDFLHSDNHVIYEGKPKQDALSAS